MATASHSTGLQIQDMDSGDRDLPELVVTVPDTGLLGRESPVKVRECYYTCASQSVLANQCSPLPGPRPRA